MKLAVKETAEARGFRNAKDLADRLGLSYSSVYPLWSGTAKRIDLATLTRLCRGLKANAGLLLVYDPTDDDDLDVAPPAAKTNSRKNAKK
ncbi:MAG TPA: helix-turn-helix domain-containing protein [Blastocatellia bacterium]